MRLLLIGAAGLLIAAPAWAQQPAPQYSVEDLERSLTGAPPPAAAGDCEGRGMVTGPDGACQPRISGRRGFSLTAPQAAPAPRTTAAPAPPARRPAPAPGRTAPPAVVATAPTPPPASAPAAPAPRAFDLLVTFENASTALTEQAKSNMKVFAEALNRPQLRRARFAIDGHTDAIGRRDYNQTLSRARADAVVDYLASLGVERSRFDVHGYGFDQPLNSGNPRAAENRRVEARRLS